MYRPIASLVRCAGSFTRQSGWSCRTATLSPYRQSGWSGMTVTLAPYCPYSLKQLHTSTMLGCNEEVFNAEDEKPKVAMTLRTIVTGHEARSIIGRGGEIVNDIRQKSGAKIRIEGSSPLERILTVDGTADSIFKAYTLICIALEGRERLNSKDSPESCTEPEEGLKLNLLVPSSQCGAIIGKEGSKIKEICETIGVDINVSGEPLPDSSERSVKVSGSVEEVAMCIHQICCLLLESPLKGKPRLYRPFSSLSVPNDVVGALIGKGGEKINRIRQISGAIIHIQAGQRNGETIIKISGSTTSMTSAKNLIWKALDMVKREDEVERDGLGDTDDRRRRTSQAVSFAGDVVTLPPGSLEKNPSDKIYEEDVLLECPPEGKPRLHQPEAEFSTMSVPNDFVGAVIGKRGAKINEIRQMSGATIHIKTGQREGEGIPDTDRETIIEISGSTTAVTLAKSLINKVLDMYADMDKRVNEVEKDGAGSRPEV